MKLYDYYNICRSVLVLNENSADIAKHCIPVVAERR